LSIIVVGGSNKSVGKTALICGILSALPDFHWTGIKITSHRYGHAQHIWEEPAARSARDDEKWTDTTRFLAAGARRAFLLSREQTEFSQVVGELLASLEPGANLIFESNRIVEYLKPHLCLGLVGEGVAKNSYSLFMRCADALVVADTVPQLAAPTPTIPAFRLADLKNISPELLEWLHLRLSAKHPG
jgi:hypothetical protein